MSQPSQWNNATVQTCQVVYDTLDALGDCNVPLPRGRTAFDFWDVTCDVILNYGQEVLDDERVWEATPEHVSTLHTRDSLRAQLKQALDESR